MQEPSDRQLVSDIQKGDRVAMETFFRRYSPYLYAVCLRYMSDPEESKDLLHDAFMRIFSAVHTFCADPGQTDAELRRSLKGWCARITANLALNRLREQQHMQFVPIDSFPGDDIPDSEIDAESLSADTIMRLIEDLPPNYRAVFSLFAIEGFTHREIAGMLGISEGLSATQYHRARAMLKKIIRNHLDKNA